MQGKTDFPRSRRGRLIHKATWLVLVGGLVVSAIASVSARNVAMNDEKRILAQNASLTGDEMSSLVGVAQNSLVAALAVAKATGANQATFDRATKTNGNFFNSWVVERSVNGTWQRVLTSNVSATVLTEAAPVLSQLQQAKSGTFRVLGFLGADEHRALTVGERDGNYLVMASANLSEATVLSTAQSEAQYLGIHGQFALFTAGGEKLSNAVLSSTSHLPLTGRRAIVIVDPSTDQAAGPPRFGTSPDSIEVPPGDLLLVVTSHGWMSGAMAADFPWILLVVTGLAAITMAVAVELVLRRRDDALTAVDRLEAKNRDLDRALAEQAQAERDRQEMEAQLRAAQRMEAVGNLAGGVAHDFNNLLAVILNYAQFAVEELDGHPAKQDLEEVVGAARRAAELTRQLLVFSRRDIIEPRVIDLNQIVEGMHRLLARTIGEDIALQTDLDPHLPLIKADEGELEQVLMNLAVNSRDAIATSGGRVTVTTATVELSERDARQHPEMRPGRYASLTVADNGSGMSEEVLARAFDPFFTTKPVGQGTGLGLASVYGIVKRWGGEVQARSEEGDGTAVTVLLPVTYDGAECPGAPVSRPSPETSDATVLVVEDQDAVRQVARRVLERAGYHVLEASSGAEALARPGLSEVDLLLTDVVMPGGVSGHDLSLELQARYPQLRVLYMSGYTADVISRRGALEDGLALLEKPFNADSLLYAVAAALDLTPQHAAV